MFTTRLKVLCKFREPFRKNMLDHRITPLYFYVKQHWIKKLKLYNRCSDLNDKEDILGGVGDGEYGRARQCGYGCRLDVRTQHRLRLLRVEIEEKVL